MPELRTISIYESQKIQLDENNKLYWDGKPLVAEERLVFQNALTGLFIYRQFLRRCML
jgi:hypothetical protein